MQIFTLIQLMFLAELTKYVLAGGLALVLVILVARKLF